MKLTEVQLEIMKHHANKNFESCKMFNCDVCVFSIDRYKNYFNIQCGLPTRKQRHEFCVNYFKKQLEFDF